MITEQAISEIESLFKDSWLILFAEEEVKAQIISALKLENQHYLIDGMKITMVRRVYRLEEMFSQLSDFNTILLLAVAKIPKGFKATAIHQAKGISLRDATPQLLKTIKDFLISSVKEAPHAKEGA